MFRFHICLSWLLGLFACQQPPYGHTSFDAPGRSLVSMDARFDQIVAPETEIEVLAGGFDWTEGPVWIEAGQYLLFTDIPPNSIFKWKEGEGSSLYLKPAGYTSQTERGGEVGANGLLQDAEGKLVLCQHGNRQVARMNAPLEAPLPDFVPLATHYQDQRFNSPNDATFRKDGSLFFTDPPYGLEYNMDDPAKEIEFQGVYQVSPDGEVTLVTAELSRPNGIGFSPTEETLYVANSDPKRAIWMSYPVSDSSIGEGSIFFDATDQVGADNKGLPDGLAVRSDGTIFATGPGGVWVFHPDGTPLGQIRTGQATSNCTLDTQEGYLYMTADMFVMRVKLL
ncbi:MAG: SMP-30/gluconolactonase/LRE family protein [Bacteroidota bacterium]